MRHFYELVNETLCLHLFLIVFLKKKKKKNLMLDKTSSKHREYQGPVHFEKSQLCSDFVS